MRERRSTGCLALAGFGSLAAAQQAPVAAQLAPVIVKGNYDNAVGSSDAASQGTVNAALIESRPTLRPAEVLEFVPGVSVTQHSGDGKANQYFLRGFNLDHGTDFASFVGGMPVNMPTHAHRHGYSDLNWLLPELVNRINYKKGPYDADEGDFASAGAAHIRLFDSLPNGITSVTLGENGYRRGLLANSSALGAGQLLYAVEAAHNAGPWENPEKFHRTNGALRYSFGDAGNMTAITAMAYSAGWHSTDQFEQAEQRRAFGLTTSRSWNTQLGGRDTTFTAGLQLRHDRFDFKVASSIAANSGKRHASIASPKLSLIFGSWSKTEFFANAGCGFHSNDARGTTATVAAKSPNGLAIDPVKPLVRSKGFEFGGRTELIPGLQSSLALRALKLDSELLFVGDAGETEPSRASKRHGVEWNNHYIATKWLLLDADLSASRSRFTEPDPVEPRSVRLSLSANF